MQYDPLTPESLFRVSHSIMSCPTSVKGVNLKRVKVKQSTTATEKLFYYQNALVQRPFSKVFSEMSAYWCNFENLGRFNSTKVTLWYTRSSPRPHDQR